MNSNIFVIVFVVLLVAFLAFPIVMKQLKGANTAAPAKVSTQGVPAGTSAESAVHKYPELNEPPLLNEGNLVGTEWQVIAQNYKIKITLGPGGVCYASHPMAKALTGMDYVEGRWNVQGDKLHASASVAGYSADVALTISGMKLFYVDPKTGKPDEVRRF